MFRKTFAILLLILPVGLLLILFSQKSNLEGYLSSEMKTMIAPSEREKLSETIDSLYNYVGNNSNYSITFLEFGAIGCTACRQMEAVMNEVNTSYQGQINVVFLNILKPVNQELMKYYGISAIPTQILLDSTGTEYFRHTGFISTENLATQFY